MSTTLADSEFSATCLEGPFMDAKDELLITVATFPASDNWGFVGVVSVGDQEAYRTIRAYTTPGEALAATQGLLADVLGGLMAGQEWRAAQSEFGHRAGVRATGKGRAPRGRGSLRGLTSR